MSLLPKGIHLNVLSWPGAALEIAGWPWEFRLSCFPVVLHGFTIRSLSYAACHLLSQNDLR